MLTFIANTARPDVAFAVNRMVQFTSKPTKMYFNLTLRIAQYLHATKRLSLVYRSSNTVQVNCYTDSDHARDKESRKSTSGCALLLNGTAVCWFSRKQKCIAQSTCEAEVIAANEATKECIWLKHMFEELEVESEIPWNLHCDPQSAIGLITNRSFHSKSKHVDYRLKLTRERV